MTGEPQVPRSTWREPASGRTSDGPGSSTSFTGSTGSTGGSPHEKHRSDLLHFAERLTHDRALAEDVVQEALLRAWRHPELAHRDDGAVRSWLFTVARHLVIDRWRSAAVRHEIASDVTELSPSREDASSAVLDRWLILDALRTLSEEHRRVIVAAHYEGRPIAEISRLLQVPEGTVKSRLHYGLRMLRLALQEKGVTRP
jgi:RNA polymerase sigma-70 factor (ECF subfamily)